MSTLRLALLLCLGLWWGGCAGTQQDRLDRDFLQYRYEGQKLRREQLESLYEEERARCEELTRRILELREEIGRREAELGELRGRAATLRN